MMGEGSHLGRPPTALCKKSTSIDPLYLSTHPQLLATYPPYTYLAKFIENPTINATACNNQSPNAHPKRPQKKNQGSSTKQPNTPAESASRQSSRSTRSRLASMASFAAAHAEPGPPSAWPDAAAAGSVNPTDMFSRSMFCGPVTSGPPEWAAKWTQIGMSNNDPGVGYMYS